MDAGVVPAGQDAHPHAPVVSRLLELTNDLGDLSVGPRAEVDLGHTLLLDLFLAGVALDLSELGVAGVVRVLDEKTCQVRVRLKICLGYVA